MYRHWRRHIHGSEKKRVTGQRRHPSSNEGKESVVATEKRKVKEHRKACSAIIKGKRTSPDEKKELVSPQKGKKRREAKRKKGEWHYRINQAVFP